MWSTLVSIAWRASLTDWLVLGASLLLGAWLLGTWTYDFFKKRGVASTRPKAPFMGDSGSAFVGFISFADLVQDLYNSGKGHSVYGLFEFSRPIFMIRDPELIKIVAVKEFDKFMNHRLAFGDNTEPLFQKSLFMLRDQPWKDMRSTLSPAFTTSKIRGMFSLVSKCGEQMVEHLQAKYKAQPGRQKEALEVDMKDLFTRMATDAIATVAFGLSCDSLKNPDNEFYRKGKEITTISILQGLIAMFIVFFPSIAKFFGLRLMKKTTADYFDSLVRETVRERQKQGIFRPDMLQLLMQARQGQLKADAADEHEEEKLSKAKTPLKDEDLTAQAIIFFFAGFETVSTAMCFTQYALSHNKDAQKRLQEEIDDVWKRTGGKPSYEDIQGMKYLDAVVNEGLRMHPPVVAVDRQCLEATVLPPTKHSGPTPIRRDDLIWIPVMGLHYDPQYWPEPQQFNPDRFNDENKHNIQPFTYMPFGGGPRICLGQRLALIEVKLVLAHLLANFNFDPSPKTKYPLEYDKGFNLMVKGGFWSLLTPRNT